LLNVLLQALKQFNSKFQSGNIKQNQAISSINLSSNKEFSNFSNSGFSKEQKRL
jgi:hypothetical protein